MRFPKKGEVYDRTIFRTFRYVGIFEIHRSPLVSSSSSAFSLPISLLFGMKKDITLLSERRGQEKRAEGAKCFVSPEAKSFVLDLKCHGRLVFLFRLESI